MLGQFAFFHQLFHPSLHSIADPLAGPVFHWLFTGLSQIGLILLLLLIGLEFDFGHLRWNGMAASGISFAGIAFPFALGAAISPLVLVGIGPEFQTNRLHFALFLATALSITALPVLARIMVELNIQRTRIGTITIASAAVNDALGWILLAAIAAMVKAQSSDDFDFLSTAAMLAAVIGFVVVMIGAVRPLLCRWARHAIQSDASGVDTLTIFLCVLLTCAIASSLIGIGAVFGAFMLGAIVSGEREFCTAITRQLRNFVHAFFVPIFFTYTGLRTQVQALDSLELWLVCGLVIATAIAGKLLACSTAARLAGFAWRESLCIGALMNTRGLMELVVVNVGYDLGVIPKSVYCMLVLMAIVTTIMTTPLVVRLGRGTELEPALKNEKGTSSVDVPVRS